MKKTLKLLPILLVNFIGTLGFSLVIPFLVIVVHNFGGDAIVYGLVAAMYPFFQFIGAPILGKWSDEWGRAPVLLISQLGTLLSWAIFLVALYLPIQTLFEVDLPIIGLFVVTLPLVVVVIARSLDGLTGGNISVAQAYLADVSNENDRSANFGRFQVASTLGFILGPALAGILGSTFLGEKLPVMAALVISFIASIYIAWFLPEPKRKRQTKKQQVNFVKVLKMPKVGFLVSIYFLLFMGFSLFYTAFPVFATQGLSWSVGKMGIYFAVMSALMAVVQGPVLAKVSKIWSEKTLIVVGTFLLAINFMLLASGREFLIYLALLFFALGNGVGWASLLALLSKAAGKHNQGIVHGTAMSGGSLASMIGLLGGGILYANITEWTFLVSAGVMLFVAVLVLGFKD